MIASDRDEHELYDLAADPGETVDLAPGRPDDVARLRERLAIWVRAESRAPGTFEPVADPEAIEALRELGYVD